MSVVSLAHFEFLHARTAPKVFFVEGALVVAGDGEALRIDLATGAISAGAAPNAPPQPSEPPRVRVRIVQVDFLDAERRMIERRGAEISSRIFGRRGEALRFEAGKSDLTFRAFEPCIGRSATIAAGVSRGGATRPTAPGELFLARAAGDGLAIVVVPVRVGLGLQVVVSDTHVAVVDASRIVCVRAASFGLSQGTVSVEARFRVLSGPGGPTPEADVVLPARPFESLPSPAADPEFETATAKARLGRRSDVLLPDLATRAAAARVVIPASLRALILRADRRRFREALEDLGLEFHEGIRTMAEIDVLAPASFVPFATDGFGDVFGLVAAGRAPCVIRYQHEDDEFVPAGDTFDEFMDALLEEAAEDPNADEIDLERAALVNRTLQKSRQAADGSR